MMDNITIYVDPDEEVAEAIEIHKEYIMNETLAVAVENRQGLDTSDLNGHKTGIDVERV